MGVGRIEKLGFRRESVFFKPFQKLRAVGCNDFGLRIMGMAIHKAGHDQVAGVGFDFDPRVASQKGGCFPDLRDLAGADHHGTIGMKTCGVLGVGVERIGAE